MTIGKNVIIDGSGHLMGRLASIVAKQLLLGRRVTVVRCENITLSGTQVRREILWKHFERKSTNTNPRRGPFHERAPSDIFRRCVRSQLPKKNHRGRTALKNLHTYETVPPTLMRKPRVVVPQALRYLRLRPDRKYTKLGSLCKEIGWKHSRAVSISEKNRIKLSSKHFQKKTKSRQLLSQAKKNVADKIAPVDAELAKLGY